MAAIQTSRRLADAHWRRLDRLRKTLEPRVAALVARGDVETAAQLMLAGQRIAVSQTDAYMAMAVSEALLISSQPIGIDPEPLIGRAARHGRPLEDVYGAARKVGRQDGFDRGLAYLRQQITTDVGLAQRNASHAVMEADNTVIGWRRMTSPGGGKTCGMCIAASTRMYHRGDLLPIHRMCRCTVAPVYESTATQRSIDQARLDLVYEQSGGATAYASLTKVRIDDSALPGGVDPQEIAALNVRIVRDPEIGIALDADRHDTHFVLA